MYLGPHTKKEATPHRQRETARQRGWTAIQTHLGNPRSLRNSRTTHTPEEIGPLQHTDPIWVVHAAYPAHVAHYGDHKPLEYATANYLKDLITTTREIGGHYVVVHVGGTKDRETDEVLQAIIQFLTNHGFEDYFCKTQPAGELPTQLLIENVAANYPFNRDLTALIEAAKQHNVGWCLDLAHAWAAGISPEDLARLIERTPRVDQPKICHANFPGSPAGSGRDRHGWRSQVAEDGYVPAQMTKDDVIQWDALLSVIANQEIPLILEGGSTAGDMEQEIEYIRNLVST